MRVVLTLLIGVGIFAAVYAALCAFLYFRQDEFLFFPVTNDPRLASQWQPHRVSIPANDVAVEGWWAENTNAGNDIVILYFGGNAEDVLFSAEAAERLHARRFLATNYRGYGKTPGRPSEAALFADALAIYDYAIAQPGVAAENIVVMGRSLGSGVATYVAAQRSVRGVVLVTPYDSIVAVAQTHYPYIPVSWLLKNRFESADRAREIRRPVLILSAELDEVIPAIHTQRLFASWAGPKQSFVLSGVGHNDIDQENQYYVHINGFIDTPR